MTVDRLIVSGLILFVSSAAAYADWRYCLASTGADRKVFVSSPFPTGASIEATESGFEKMLQQSGIAHENVQCPRASTRTAIKIARKDAIDFNKEFMDRAIVELSWKPNVAQSSGRQAKLKRSPVRALPTPSADENDLSVVADQEWAQMDKLELLMSIGR